MSTYAAVDPGLKGAIGVISESGAYLWVVDMPSTPHDVVEVVTGLPMGVRAVIEAQQPFPKQGLSSTFQTGKGYGQLLGVFAALQIPHEIVSAATWKRAMGLSADKQRSREMARRLWPDAPLHLQKHDGRAEALLLAEWIRRREIGKR